MSAHKVLPALTVAVVVGHWLALGGGMPSWPGQGTEKSPHIGALLSTGSTPQDANPTAGLETTPNTEASTAPVVITASVVRWIAPPEPIPEPQPEVKPPDAPAATLPVKEPKPAPTPALEFEVGAGPASTDTVGTTSPEAASDTAPPELAPPLLTAAETALAPAPEPVLEPAPTTSPISERATTPRTPPPAASAAPALGPEATRVTESPSANQPVNPLTPRSTPITFPPNATLKYKVRGKASGFEYSANGTLTWNQDEANYEARQEVSVFLLGTFLQVSTGQVTPEGLTPNRFSDARRGKEKTAQFDYANKRIRYSNKSPDAALLQGAQDQLSATLQLATLISANPNLPLGHLVKLPVSSTAHSEVWQFEVGPLKSLTLPAGEIEARLLTRAPRKPRDKTVQLWLAPSLGYLPVRMRLSEHDGDFLDQLLSDMPDIQVQPTQPRVDP